jgi:hypothetical protein
MHAMLRGGEEAGREPVGREPVFFEEPEDPRANVVAFRPRKSA